MCVCVQVVFTCTQCSCECVCVCKLVLHVCSVAVNVCVCVQVVFTCMQCSCECVCVQVIFFSKLFSFALLFFLVGVCIFYYSKIKKKWNGHWNDDNVVNPTSGYLIIDIQIKEWRCRAKEKKKKKKTAKFFWVQQVSPCFQCLCIGIRHQ
jgi:hypothetical protein